MIGISVIVVQCTVYTVHIPVYNQDSMYIIYPSPGSLQYSKERGEREYTHYVQFLMYCTAGTTVITLISRDVFRFSRNKNVLKNPSERKKGKFIALSWSR